MKDYRSTKAYKGSTDYIYRRFLDIINNKDIDHIKLEPIYLSRRGGKVSCSYPTPQGYRSEVIHRDRNDDADD